MIRKRKRFLSALLSVTVFAASYIVPAVTQTEAAGTDSVNIPILESILNGNRHFVIDTLIDEDMSTSPYAKAYSLDNSRSMMRTVLSKYNDKNDPDYNWMYSFCVDCVILWENKADVTEDITNSVTEMTADQLENFGGSADAAAAVLRECADSSKSMKYDNILQSVLSADYTSSSGTTISGSDSQLTNLRAIADNSKRLKNFTSYLKSLTNLDGKEKESVAQYINDVYEPAARAGEKVMSDLAAMSEASKQDGYTNKDAMSDLLKELTTQLSVAVMCNAKQAVGDSMGDTVSQLAPEHLLGQGTLDMISFTDKAASMSSAAIDSYMYIEAIQTQSDSVAGVMRRTAGFMPDSDSTRLLNNYAFLIENSGNELIKNSEWIFKTLKSQNYVANAGDKIISKGAEAVAKRLIPVYEESIIPSSMSRLTGIIDTTEQIADAVSGGKQTAMKTYELKNTDDLLKLFIKTYKQDLAAYNSDKTDENAARVLDDLEFIQRIRLRGETLAYKMTVNQLETPLGRLLSGGYDWTDYYDEAYQRNVDILIGASVAPITTEDVKIPSNAKAYIDYDDNIGIYATITDSERTYYIPELERLAPNGIKVGSGVQMILMPKLLGNIPYISNSSGKVSVVNDNISIAEYDQSGGELSAAGKNTLSIGKATINGGKLTASNGASFAAGNISTSGNTEIAGDLKAVNTFKNSGQLTVSDSNSITAEKMSVNSGSIKGGTYNPKSDCSNTGTMSPTTLNLVNDYYGSGKTSVLNLNIYERDRMNIEGDITTGTLNSSGGGEVSLANSVVVTGTLPMQGVTYKNKPITLTGSFAGNTYNGDVNFRNTTLSKPITINGSVTNDGGLFVNDRAIFNGDFSSTSNAEINAPLSVKKALTNQKTMTVNSNLAVDGSFTNNDKVNINENASLTTNGIAVNKSNISGNGKLITTNDMSNTGSITVANLNIKNDFYTTGTANVTSLDIYTNSSFEIKGDITTGTLTSNGGGEVSLEKSIVVTGMLPMQGVTYKNKPITLTGSFADSVYKGDVNFRNTTLSKPVTINGTVTNDGGLIVNDKAIINGNFTNTSSVEINAPISIRNIFTNNNEITINQNGSLTANGIAVNKSNISGSGKLVTTSAMSNAGSITVGGLNIKNDFYTTGTTNVTSLDIYTDSSFDIEGNITTGMLTSSGGGEVSLEKSIVVTDTLPMQGITYKNKPITLTGSFADSVYKGDVNFRNTTLSKPITINGTVTNDGGLIVNDKAIFNGDFTNTSSAEINAPLSVKKALTNQNTITVNSDVTADGSFTNNDKININENCTFTAYGMTVNKSNISGNGRFMMLNDILNTGTVDVGTLDINEDYYNKGTTKAQTLNINENTSSVINGNNIETANLNVSGGGKIDLQTNINVADKYVNNSAEIDDMRIKLPVDADSPIAGFVSTNGLSLDGSTKEIHGNCDISGGDISLANGAKLIVDGIFTASGSSFNIENGCEIIVKKYAVLKNFSNIANDGTMQVQSDMSLTSTKLGGEGEYILYGDLIMSSSSVNKPKLFTLAGAAPQKLTGNMVFDTINIRNSSISGVEFANEAFYCGELKNDNTVIKGSITKKEDQ